MGQSVGCSGVKACLLQHLQHGSLKTLLLRLTGLILPFLKLFIHPSDPAGLGRITGALVKDLLSTKTSSLQWGTSAYPSD